MFVTRAAAGRDVTGRPHGRQAIIWCTGSTVVVATWRTWCCSAIAITGWFTRGGGSWSKPTTVECSRSRRPWICSLRHGVPVATQPPDRSRAAIRLVITYPDGLQYVDIKVG